MSWMFSLFESAGSYSGDGLSYNAREEYGWLACVLAADWVFTGISSTSKAEAGGD
jgi:hypothetical protein